MKARNARMLEVQVRTQTSDDPLLDRAVAGDAKAFGDLYRRHLDGIYRFMFYRVGSVQEAEDLTEQTFLQAWQAISEYQRQGNGFRAWLYRIARNLSIDHHRTRREHDPLDTVPPLDASSVSEPEAETIRRDQIRQLQAHLARLSEEHRQILLLRFIEGMSHAEAADVMGRSPGATRVLQHRALVALSEIVRRSGDES